MLNTTLHPAILDCMLQSSLIIAASDTGSRARDLLPRAVRALTVHRPVREPVMLVHARASFKGSKQHVYDLLLLSLRGEVLATLDGVVSSWLLIVVVVVMVVVVVVMVAAVVVVAVVAVIVVVVMVVAVVVVIVVVVVYC